MKIAIFTNNYLPNPYGVPGSVESFRKEFERLGHTVYIFAPKWLGYADTNPNVFRYPSIDIKYKFRFPLAIPYSWKMRQILQNLEIDVIHSQHPNLLGSAARRWAKKKKVPLVFTWHTLYDHYAHFVPLVPEKIAAWWTIRNARIYANRADAVVVPTDSIMPILQKWGVKKEMTAVATGVNEKLLANPERTKIRARHRIADSDIVLVLVSRLTQEKNIVFILRAVKDIFKNNSQVKFLLGGEGYLLPELKKFAADNGIANKVIFPGLVKDTELKDYLAAGDIFVHSSTSETQGMIMSEAMYLGLPIVAVAAPGANSLVINRINGLLVSEIEIDFAAAVQRLIDNPELRAQLAAASLKLGKNYTSAVSAQKMLGVYEKAIARKGGLGVK